MEPTNEIAEQALMCYIISAHKGQSDLEMITDKVQVSAASTPLYFTLAGLLLISHFITSHLVLHRVLFYLTDGAFLAPHVQH